ncbi:MAG: polyprenyl synthetase family protein [Gammaproteobacteria bacterium]|nr:polyprenyl synthetase family protein [Gammaproteobacteria bacterium]
MLEFTQIRELVAGDLATVKAALLVATGAHPVFDEVNAHLGGGGKQMRALLLLLVARACGAENGAAVRLATIVERIHTASLLHDDVIDEAKERRNVEAANVVWGNKVAILAGDYLLTQSFCDLLQAGDKDAMRILASGVEQILAAATDELQHNGDFTLTREQYLDIVTGKTATLFAVAAELAAAISDVTVSESEALRLYGLNFGIAFQLADDLLDIAADIVEGKITLPILLALDSITDIELRQHITQTLNESVFSDELLTILNAGAITRTQLLAKEYVEIAQAHLDILPPSIYRDGLADLALLALTRKN